MTTQPTTPSGRTPDLLGQTVVVIGGSAGIGLETARRAAIEGADIILVARNPSRLQQAALDVGAGRTVVFDATDADAVRSFFLDLSTPIDHVMVTAGTPHYGPPLAMSTDQARLGLTEHLLIALDVARNAAGKVRPAGSLIFRRYRRTSAADWPGHRIDSDGRIPYADRKPGSGACADPRQPHRRGFCRHRSFCSDSWR